ncbi:MAG: sporulation protein YabP [Firmicutes bacterium]|nr:sporulation protein YabP [Bacillota bacterium]
MAEDRMRLPHKLTLNERQQLSMTGVTEVVSFDESAVVLLTELGRLTVHGQGLQLRQLALDGGQVAVDGNVSAIVYEEPKPAGGWLRRLMG